MLSIVFVRIHFDVEKKEFRARKGWQKLLITLKPKRKTAFEYLITYKGHWKFFLFRSEEKIKKQSCSNDLQHLLCISYCLIWK
jgi:hypothetical protein